VTKKKGSVLSTGAEIDYIEEVPEIDRVEFQKVIDSRRSVRFFTDDNIPEDVIERVLNNGLLAPNSSNLQPWEFYRVIDGEKKKLFVKACLNQTAARTASELFVVVARTDTWKNHAKEMLDLFNNASAEVPEIVKNYYGKIVPFVYTQGLFSIFGFVKRMIFFIQGLKKPIIREPVKKSDMKTWAVKTTALAAENIMLSLRAEGFDSCPMEGYDSKRIKKILGLTCGSIVVMVIAAGKRDSKGIYGKRIRFDSKRFLKTV
jgi:nitroreductase